MKYDVINIADICTDIVISGNSKPSFNQVETLAHNYELELGGSGAIFSSQFSKLGGKVAVITTVGNDFFGNYLVNRMHEIGIDTSFVKFSDCNKTPLSANISIKQDRSILTVPGTYEEINFDLVDVEMTKQTQHWHVAGYFLLSNLIPHWSDFLLSLKKLGISCSLDTNWDPNCDWESVKTILPLIDVFLPNEQEAISITNKSNYREAGVELAKTIPLVVIKRGENGASVFIKDKEYTILPEEVFNEKIDVIDTTGAGDSFNAGFLFNWIHGKSIRECLELGIKCGSSNVSKIGGIKGQYTI